MIQYLLAGLLGLIFVTLSKMQTMKTEYLNANHVFSVKKFFTDELVGIGMSLCVLILMVVTMKEWIVIDPRAVKFVTIIFAMGGAIGSWAFGTFLGGSQKYIRRIIDEKTNIADGIVKP